MSRRYRLSLLMGCPAGGVSCTGTCSPCRCGACRGGLPSLSPANPTFSLLSCPLSPQPPSPEGKGEIFLFSYARGFAPCIPGIRPPAALTEPAMQVTGGGLLPLRHLFALPLWFPAGGLPSLSPAAPAFSFLSCPLSPRPPSPVGKGEIF